MQTVVGIFPKCGEAYAAARALEAVPGTCSWVVGAEASIREFKAIPADETEQPGMGPAIGGVMGGGFAAALVTLLVPLVGPLAMIGIAAGAVVGAGGGMLAGRALEDEMSSGLTKGEVAFYEDILRRGECPLFAFFEDRDLTDGVREILVREGARSVDAARGAPWIGLQADPPAV